MGAIIPSKSSKTDEPNHLGSLTGGREAEAVAGWTQTCVTSEHHGSTCQYQQCWLFHSDKKKKKTVCRSQTRPLETNQYYEQQPYIDCFWYCTWHLHKFLSLKSETQLQSKYGLTVAQSSLFSKSSVIAVLVIICVSVSMRERERWEEVFNHVLECSCVQISSTCPIAASFAQASMAFSSIRST